MPSCTYRAHIAPETTLLGRSYDREGRLPSTGDGHLPLNRRGTGHRAGPFTGRRRAPGAPGTPAQQRGRHEWLSSASVILAGVLLVIGFGFVASRAIRSHDSPPTIPEAQAPAIGEITLPPTINQSPIQLESPSPSPSPTPTPSPSSASPPPDPGGITLTRADVPATVDLTAEGSRDWVHWGEQSTFSLERDKKGGFAILEGAPTAPRFRHALSPQRFAWTGGDPVDHTDGGTPTGIRTCGKGNGFTISAPAAPATRVLRLYIGTLGARGKLSASLSTGSADASTTLEQQAATMRTAVLTITYRAPKNGRLQLTWITDKTFATGCAGVALEAATLR